MPSSSYDSNGPEAGRQDEPSAVDWVRRSGQADVFLSTLERQMKRRRRLRWRQAVGAALVLVVAGFVWVSNPSGPALSPGSPKAVVLGAGARHVLVDGSEVDLDEGADVSVIFDAQSRRVALQRGLAHFRVAKSPVPFVVSAGHVEVRAVGTAFTTELTSAGEVEVLVTEGIVAIDRPVHNGATSSSLHEEGEISSLGPGRTIRTVALLKAGNRLSIPAGTLATDLERQIAMLSDSEIARRLDWRVPQLSFNATPLAEAIPMFNRHSKIQLRLADDATGAVKVSGTLRGDNVAPLVRMLELEHGLKAERQSDVIILSGPPPPGR